MSLRASWECSSANAIRCRNWRRGDAERSQGSISCVARHGYPEDSRLSASSSRPFPFSLFAKSEKGCPQWKDCLAAALRYGNIDSAVCLKRFIDWSHYRPENREIMLRTKTRASCKTFAVADGTSPSLPKNTEFSQSCEDTGGGALGPLRPCGFASLRQPDAYGAGESVATEVLQLLHHNIASAINVVDSVGRAAPRIEPPSALGSPGGCVPSLRREMFEAVSAVGTAFGIISGIYERCFACSGGWAWSFCAGIEALLRGASVRSPHEMREKSVADWLKASLGMASAEA